MLVKPALSVTERKAERMAVAYTDYWDQYSRAIKILERRNKLHGKKKTTATEDITNLQLFGEILLQLLQWNHLPLDAS